MVNMRYLLALVAAVTFDGSLLQAQPVRGVTRQITASPRELVSRLRRAPGPDEADQARADITHVLLNRGDYQPANVDELLNTLEQLALSGSANRVRASAAMMLATPGLRTAPDPMQGTVGRMIRLYHASSDPLVKGVILSTLPRVAECQPALRLLRSVAAAPLQSPDFPAAPSTALGALAAMGDEGRAVLRELHVTGAVRDPSARRELAVLAERGFRIR